VLISRDGNVRFTTVICNLSDHLLLRYPYFLSLHCLFSFAVSMRKFLEHFLLIRSIGVILSEWNTFWSKKMNPNFYQIKFSWKWWYIPNFYKTKVSRVPFKIGRYHLLHKVSLAITFTVPLIFRVGAVPYNLLALFYLHS